MKPPIDQTEQFRALHQTSTPLFLQNIWDAGSASAVEKNGATAIATSSWAIAESRGYRDGQNLLRCEMLKTITEIRNATHLPLTCDIEAGYGDSPEEVACFLKELLPIGIDGINIEDQRIGETVLYGIEDQYERLKAVRFSAEALGIDLYINARTDVFFMEQQGQPDDSKLEQVIERAKAYAEAGSDCLFVPNLVDLTMIEHLCQSSPLPINIMLPPDGPLVADLAKVGVKRISTGPFSYLASLDALIKASPK